MQINQNKRKQSLILLSFVASVILTSLKFFAFYLTDSSAILSDALESIINVIASGFAFYSVRLSALPKDKNHPYGHGKVEFFSAGFEGALIIIAALFIGYEAIQRLLYPTPLQNLSSGLWIILFTLVVNGLIGMLLVEEGKKYNSLALTADGRHLLSDSLSSVLLLISILLVMFTGQIWIDSAASLLFGSIIAYSGFKLVRKSVSGLMDETDDKLVQKIVNTIRDNKKLYWVDVHNLRVQQYGADLHIDCHLTLPYYWSLLKTHEAIHEFEEILKASHEGETEIFVHADPCIPECCHFCRVPDCPVRSHPFERDLNWNDGNLVKNQKLFIEAQRKKKEY